MQYNFILVVVDKAFNLKSFQIVYINIKYYIILKALSEITVLEKLKIKLIFFKAKHVNS